jgi:transcriptional regulator with XRE-family HTH domain
MELGITRQDLASLMGISVNQMQKYEKGLNRISSVRLFALAECFKVPINYFFEQNK